MSQLIEEPVKTPHKFNPDEHYRHPTDRKKTWCGVELEDFDEDLFFITYEVACVVCMDLYRTLGGVTWWTLARSANGIRRGK